MAFLLFCGLVSLLVGLLLMLAPKVLGSFGSAVNVTVITLNGWLETIRIWIGLGLLAIGIWLLYVGIQYPHWLINTAWMISIAFALLFLFSPGLLRALSKLSNQVLLSTDEIVLGSRKIVGIVMLIIGGYILYAALLVK